MYSFLPTETSLWDFSLHYYGRPGVSLLCLRLQDEYGVNVNIVLWTLWLGHQGIHLDPAKLAQAIHETRNWDQHYVLPLRQLRRQMKAEFGVEDTSIETVRVQIKHAELLAEKHLQQLLEAQIIVDKTIASTTSGSLFAENLRLYLQPLGVEESLITRLLSLLD
ncbi:TIGR02444 family protein [Cellvibrio mixtus]|uniref:TIGR02444 family protein n=1 Tax=Cellvibrio mixtus TaxID=39650 RepID=UPI000A6C7BCA|nr:TIGR02444 family protein [Cellvibrio mixtus]